MRQGSRQQSIAIDAEKAELLKAKGEMTKSFKSTADAVRTTGKKYFGVPHNGRASIDQEAFLKDLREEMTRQHPNVQMNPAL